MQLTYRGQTYQMTPVVRPIITAEKELAITYRGTQTIIKQYQFQFASLKNPNWRMMRFLGKRYVANPTLILSLTTS